MARLYSGNMGRNELDIQEDSLIPGILGVTPRIVFEDNHSYSGGSKVIEVDFGGRDFRETQLYAVGGRR
jgi:hypothetical protein